MAALPTDEKTGLVDLTMSSPLLEVKCLPSQHRRQIVSGISSKLAPKIEPKNEIIDPDPIDLCISSPVRKTPPIVKHKRSSSVITISDSESDEEKKPAPAPSRPQQPTTSSLKISVLPEIKVGTVFKSSDKARAAIFAYQEKLGHIWRVSQSKRGSDGSQRKFIFRCNHYYHHKPTHLSHIDPSDHREGKTIKTDCSARVNVNRLPGDLWNVTLVEFNHNHPPELPPGASAPRRPTAAQKFKVQHLASHRNFTRSQIGSLLKDESNSLEPRQISNLINSARIEARREIASLGGDIATILTNLQQKRAEDSRWNHELRLNENQQVIGLWWQSPIQAELTRRFPDILINDNTYNRNTYGYPLNIGIGVDTFLASRNLWYAFHESEDVETHNWVFRCHLESAGTHPECLFSDHHPSLIEAREITMPLTSHFYCLHHLDGNIATNLRPGLGSEWDNFTRDFWAAYRAPSPDEFDKLWHALPARYPTANHEYLDGLYRCRDRWAWAWISTIFTAGIRTNGRVEAENRVNKAIGGPKKTLFQLFNALNDRTSTQAVSDTIRVREVSFFIPSSDLSF